MLGTGVRRIVVVLGITRPAAARPLPFPVHGVVLGRAGVGVGLAGAAEGAEERKKRNGCKECKNGCVWSEEEREEDVGSEKRVVRW